MGEVYMRFWTASPDEEVDVKALEAHIKGPAYHLKLYYEQVQRPVPKPLAKETRSSRRLGKKKT